MMNAQELKEYNKDRKITQLCFVTRDYKKTIKYLTEKFKWGPWYVLADSQKTSSNVYFEGQPVDEWYFYYVIGDVGDMQIEIIQPITGEQPFEKFLSEKGIGIHHFKEAFSDNDELKKAIKDFEDLGNENIYGGEDGEDIYAYFDSYDALGFYYEVGNGAIGDVDLTTLPNFIEMYPPE